MEAATKDLSSGLELFNGCLHPLLLCFQLFFAQICVKHTGGGAFFGLRRRRRRRRRRSASTSTRKTKRRGGASGVVRKPGRFVGDPAGHERERGLGLELGNHVARTPDRQKVQVALVARHVASHALAPIQRPGRPPSRFLEPERHGPVLSEKRVDARVRVSVVHQHANLWVVLRNVAVERHQIGLRLRVVHPDSVVAAEEVGIWVHVQRCHDLSVGDPRLLRVAAAAHVIVQSSPRPVQKWRQRRRRRRRRSVAPEVSAVAAEVVLVDAFVVEVVVVVPADLHVDLV
mmetsp:Transcript_64550/g.129809  ORF Transcript_64550/g.129809 Transcript_64550/m.129809 type:complete len:287 (+) Transcript_64550:279-1139(+)